MTDTDRSERSTPPRLARVLSASGLAILATRNLTDLDSHIAHAEAKGVPEADRLAPAAAGLLLGGSLGVGFWKLPRLASASTAAFFAGVTPTTYGSWVVDNDTRDEELTSPFQNLTPLGTALAFFKRASNE